MFALIAGTLITGVTLYLFGLWKAGRWIRFVPYPVIAGFMAASGGLLAAGGIRIVTGTRSFAELLEPQGQGRRFIQLAVGLAFARFSFDQARKTPPRASRCAARRDTRRPTELYVPQVTHSQGRARPDGSCDLSSGAALPGPWLLKSISNINLPALFWAGGGYVALVAVTTMTLLLGLMAIEVEARLDVDLDRELRLNGMANILVGMCGGMTGTLSMSRTLLNYRAGARHRASGILRAQSACSPWRSAQRCWDTCPCPSSAPCCSNSERTCSLTG